MAMAIRRQQDNIVGQFTAFNSKFHKVEISDDYKRAIVTIPLMHVGPNKKGLFWTEKMLKKSVQLFRSVPFRYDLEGKEGSSHATNKLSSPFFDVGWTYNDDNGAWYDSKTKTLWVQGEVTHPEVIAKLSRETTDGKKEVNFASMGVIVEKAKCSICGAEWNDDQNICSNDHERLQEYNNEVCYKVPIECSKGLHAALTNDPADADAEIANCVFQELNPIDKYQSRKPKAGDYQMVPTDVKNIQGGRFNTEDKINNQTKEKEQLKNTAGFETKPVNGQQTDQQGSQTNTMPNGLSNDIGAENSLGPTPSSEMILKDLAERMKTIENKMGSFQGPTESPEVVNAASQDRFTQDNMGVTEQFMNNDALGRSNQEKLTEDGKMDEKDGQYSNAKTPVNPKPETQEAMGDPMSQIVQMLQEVLNRLPGPAETQDMGKEAQNATKSMIVDEKEPLEHKAPGDSVGEDTDEGAKKNREKMNQPGMVATADNTEEKPEEKPEEELKSEVADLKQNMSKILSRLEAADTTIPEFGSENTQSLKVEAADMTAGERATNFGDFGKWDACFNGTKSASRYGGK